MMIELRKITKTYGKKTAVTHALNNLSLTIGQGEFIAVMGRSGSGKSTLVNLLAGLTVPDAGDYIYQGKRMNLRDSRALARLRGDKIGIVLQNYALLHDRSAFDNIALPLGYRKVPKPEQRERVAASAASVGILPLLRKYPGELSGGEAQRVAIARCLVTEPELILADEPTGALDSASEQAVLQLFEQARRGGATVVLVTHSAEVARRCDRIVRIEDGRVKD